MPSKFESEIIIESHYLDTIDYHAMLEKMHDDINQAASIKTSKQVKIYGLQHNLVYTSGLNTKDSHIIDHKIEVVAARRGGSITLHNLGQLVVYFVFPLDLVQGGLKNFIRILEATIVETFWHFNLKTFVYPPHSGVFTEKGKIAFAGLGLKKGFIYHGLGINLSNSLEPYNKIFSCGLKMPMTNLISQPLAHVNTNNQNLCASFFKIFIKNLDDRQNIIPHLSPTEFRKHIESQIKHLPKIADIDFYHGANYFNQRLYFEAHETWEVWWHQMEAGPLKVFFQALIQIAMCFYKIYTKPNLNGALSLLSKAQKKLNANSFTHQYLSSDFLTELSQLEARLNEFKAKELPLAQFKNEVYLPLLITKFTDINKYHGSK